MNVSDTVEWYETVLRCHNFKSLPGKNFSEKAFDNFKKAKELIKKKK
jgi:hypothetical protein